MSELTNSPAFNYPVMLQVKNQLCVIIGSGSVALRKLQTLGNAGAAIKVIAPEFSQEFQNQAAKFQAQLIKATYHPSYLQKAFIVIAATDNFEINRAITQAAPCLCNNITEPELSNFTVPASFTQGDITVTVATAGVPSFTRLLKQQLQEEISPAYAEFLTFLHQMRQEVKEIPSSPKERTLFWRQVLNKDILKLLANHELARAKEQVLDAVTSFRTKSQNSPR